MFKNRNDAGKELSQLLLKYKGEDGVVLAIPRGGVPLGSVVAKALNFPLDLILTKKIGHPNNKEYAIGAVSLSGTILNRDSAISDDYLNCEISRIRKVLKEKHDYYTQDRDSIDLNNKVVIVVDDGIATGNTVIAALNLLAVSKPKKIILAVAVAPASFDQILQNLCVELDDWVCPLKPNNFQSVGQYYEDFSPVTDDEVVQLLRNTFVV